MNQYENMGVPMPFHVYADMGIQVNSSELPMGQPVKESILKLIQQMVLRHDCQIKQQ